MGRLTGEGVLRLRIGNELFGGVDHQLGDGDAVDVVAGVMVDDTDIAQVKYAAGAGLTRGVYLDADDALGRFRVDHIEGGDAVHPDTEVISDRFEAVVVPLGRLVGLAGFGLAFERVEPFAGSFFVNAAGPLAGRLIDLHLVAGDDAVGLNGIIDAAYHDSGAHLADYLHVEFENEIAVGFFGDEIGFADGVLGDCHDHAIIDEHGGVPVADSPAIEVLTVEESGPFRLGDGDDSVELAVVGTAGVEGHVDQTIRAGGHVADAALVFEDGFDVGDLVVHDGDSL